MDGSVVNAPLVIQAMRFGFLILLWIFVFAAFRVIRTDLSSVDHRPRPAVTARAPNPAKPKRRGRGVRQLVVTAGSLAGTKLPLSEEIITIGRAGDSTLVLTDDYASSRHARLVRHEADEWFVEDLGSTNGTYLADTKVTEPMPVPPGVPINIGKTAIELQP